jgi:diphthamide synthase (EF-2-diphthine--ammonia ligase)
MLAEDGEQSRSHGLATSVLRTQASRLGIPLATRAAPRNEYEAVFVATRDKEMGNEYLGRTLDAALVREFERLGIDPCGERGEYHTVVTDGPIFARPLALKEGPKKPRLGTWFLDVQVVSA